MTLNAQGERILLDMARELAGAADRFTRSEGQQLTRRIMANAAIDAGMRALNDKQAAAWADEEAAGV